MRILSINARLDIGGLELVSLFVCKGLKLRGHKVFELTTEGPMLNEFVTNGIEILKGRVDRRSPLGLLKGAADISRHVREKSIDLVYAQSLGPAVMSLIAKNKMKDNAVPVVWHNHSMHDTSYFLSYPLFNKFDMVVCVSEHVRKRFLKFGLNPKKTTLIHNCPAISIPSEKVCKDKKLMQELNLSVEHKIIGMVSRIDDNKGHDDLLDAVKILQTEFEEFQNMRLIIVGGGPLLSNLQNKSRRLGLDCNVIFTGPRRDVERFYSIFDVFVLPSLYETFGVVLLEAMSFAKPVVATRTGGIPEIVVENETGFLVAPRDSEALAGKLMILLKNQFLGEQMGKAGRERVEKQFSCERFIDRVERMCCLLSHKVDASILRKRSC